ncbi:hypothetical protein KPATCC21470_2635 [Kitasatospora purpeofusca]
MRAHGGPHRVDRTAPDRPSVPGPGPARRRRTRSGGARRGAVAPYVRTRPAGAWRSPGTARRTWPGHCSTRPG